MHIVHTVRGAQWKIKVYKCFKRNKEQTTSQQVVHIHYFIVFLYKKAIV